MLGYTSLEGLLTPIYPSQLWYVPPILLALLGLAALVDALTARVPDWLVLSALGAALFFSAAYEGWWMAGQRFLLAAGAFWALKCVNLLYAKLADREAFGMGDAKWTAAAAASFGIPHVLWAWVLGAWLGILWLGVRFVISLLMPGFQRYGYMHFAPALMVGLLLRIYLEPELTTLWQRLFG